MPSTHAARNRRSQTKAGGAPHLRSAAQVVSPVLAPVRRFVPILQSRGHPSPSTMRRGVDPFEGRCERL